MPPTWLPAAFMAALIALSALRVWSVQRKVSGRVFDFDRARPVQALAQRLWTLAVVLAIALSVITAIAPHWENWLAPVAHAEAERRWIATALFAVSLLISVVAQLQMGQSWRVGVPSDGPGEMVTTGLFAYSRNPVFIGFIGAALALFLWSPHMLSAVALIMIWLLAMVQVRLEEDAMRQAHGDAYEHYAAHVGRWFGRRNFHQC